MDVLQIVVLAIVQGVAEFLPISSSGHLVILSALMSEGDAPPLDVADVNVVLHVGTLLSILVVYFQRVLRLLREDRRVIGLLIVATIPAVVVGLPLKKWGGAILSDPLLAGSMLVVTGVTLLWIARQKGGRDNYVSLGYGRATWLGVAQAFAILPGISRSGSTIGAGIAAGLSRQSAATFSFLMAIPVIAGAGLLELKDMLDESGGGGTGIPLLLLGMAISFLVGLLALKGLLRCLEGGRFHWFAYWCIPIGLSVVIWQLVGRAG